MVQHLRLTFEDAVCHSHRVAYRSDDPQRGKIFRKFSCGHVVWVTAVKKACTGLTPITPCPSRSLAGSLNSWNSWYSWIGPWKKAVGTPRSNLGCWEVNEIHSSSYEAFLGYGREGTGSITCKWEQEQPCWANSGHVIPGLLSGRYQRVSLTNDPGWPVELQAQ